MADPQDSTSNGNADVLLEEPPLAVEDDLDDDLEDLDDDDLDLDLDRVSPLELGGEEDAAPAPAPAAPAPDAELVARIQRLEDAAQALADAELSRDGRRVKRKVKAATGGAGIAALIPVVLQLAGAYDLSPSSSPGSPQPSRSWARSPPAGRRRSANCR